jgi:tetratricopeptide (TPR) repeat protein
MRNLCPAVTSANARVQWYAECGMRNIYLVQLIGLFLMLTALWSVPALAEIKVIEADSAYIMGDNDSKVEARRVAVQEAKRKALELAGAYVESMTVVKNYQLTKDEVKSYAAGVLETEVVSEQMSGTPEHPEIHIKARCRVDTDAVASQVNRFHENEDLKEQLDATVKENDGLKKERDALVKQLAGQKDKTQADATRQKLAAVLSREEANDDAHTVWINIGSKLVEMDGTRQEIKQADLDRSTGVLERTVKINPQNLGAQYLLASIHQRKGDLAAAEARLRIAVKVRPSSPASHLKLGVLLRERGKYQEALREFQFVYRLRPRHPLVPFFTGMTFKDLGMCGKAVQNLNRFLKDKRISSYPAKKDKAAAAIEDCGGNRPGRHRKTRQT